MKYIFITLVCLFSGMGTAKAQDSLKVKAGFTLAPQGTVNLDDNPVAFKTFTNLFPQVTISKGKIWAVMFYSFTFNNVGGAIGYNPTPKVAIYVDGNKSTLSNSKYFGFGVGTPLASGRSTGFIELGTSSSNNWKPALYMGMFIPFTLSLR